MPESLTRGEIIGRNIHALRESKLLSKADIAERSGISWAGVDNVERGVSDSPRRKTIEPIAEVLGVTVEDLLREDLISLAARWTRPLDREERAVASIVGAARHEEQLRAGLDDALVRPLAAVVDELGRRSAARGEPIEPARLALLGSVLQAFWWQRYAAAGDGAMTVEAVERVVDDVLVPVTTSAALRPEPVAV